MLNYLLIYRWFVLNALLAGAAYMAYVEGLWHLVFASDPSRISIIIVALFAFSWVHQAVKVWKVSIQVNAAKRQNVVHHGIEKLKAMRDKEMMKVSWMDDSAGWLVGLGLIGTVVGFIMALPVDPSVVNASDAQRLVATLLIGMRVALFTTLLGATLGMWIELNRRMIHTALYVMHSNQVIKSMGGR